MSVIIGRALPDVRELPPAAAARRGEASLHARATSKAARLRVFLLNSAATR